MSDSKNVIQEVVDSVNTIIALSEIVEGDVVFASEGISRVKVTRNGKPYVMEIPIRSEGIKEAMEIDVGDAPRPPTINVKIEPGTEIANDLGIMKKQWTKMPDYSDAEYQEALTLYKRDQGLRIMLRGLAIPFKDRDGQELVDDTRKLEILKSAGLTGHHFSQIIDDITNLTKWQEDEETSFLPG